ncbi:MAG: hypothetical protein LC745_09095, partial [Planctomycetia bacterium]|nr:hypothetical protein [Planctomycetia bacterium]
MATGRGVNQGKTAFLEGFLPGNREADLEAVNGAWSAAGNAGTVSESLLGKIRAKLGLTGRRGADGGAIKKTSGPSAKGKGASKAKGAASQPNGREDGTGSSKTAFVEEMLGREPKANVKAVNGAWSAAGNEGSISDSVVYKVKRELGGAGATHTATVKPKGKSASPGPVAGPATLPTVKARPGTNKESPPSRSVGGSESGGRE